MVKKVDFYTLFLVLGRRVEEMPSIGKNAISLGSV